jgi:hypothetical protein
MADRTVPSSVFRLTYNSLSESVVVTVLGRAIGVWTPVGEMVNTMPPTTSSAPPVASPVLAAAPKGVSGSTALDGSVAGMTQANQVGMTQAERDKVLTKMRTR